MGFPITQMKSVIVLNAVGRLRKMLMEFGHLMEVTW